METTPGAAAGYASGVFTMATGVASFHLQSLRAGVLHHSAHATHATHTAATHTAAATSGGLLGLVGD